MNTKWVLTFNRNASFPRLESDKEKHWRKFRAKKCVWNEWHCLFKIKKYLFLLPICRILKAYRLMYSISKLCIEKKYTRCYYDCAAFCQSSLLQKLNNFWLFCCSRTFHSTFSITQKDLIYTIAVLSIIFLDIYRQYVLVNRRRETTKVLHDDTQVSRHLRSSWCWFY